MTAMVRLSVALVAIVLAACGGGDNASAPMPTSTATPTPTEEPTADPPEPTAGPTVEPVEEPALPTDACDAAFAETAAVDEMQDVPEDLHPAVRACTSVEDWRAGVEANPGASDADADVFLGNLCQYYPEVADTDLCAEVAG